MFSWPPAITTSAWPVMIDWAARAIALRPEPQTLLMVKAGVSLQIPALIIAWRPGFWPWPDLQDIAHDDLIDGDLAQLGIPDPVFALQGDLSLVGQFFRHGLVKIAAPDRPQADLLQGLPQDQGPQINHRHILQSAAECSHGCPASADNDHFIHFLLAPCKGYGQ